MSFIPNGHFPPINPSTSNNASSEERCTAIDFFNRHNFIFEEWDHEKIISTFLPQADVYHSHGTIRGHEEIRRFFEESYEFFIHGITRSATNHVVDRDEESGVVVRYHETLIRYGWKGDDASNVSGHDTIRTDGLPAVWWTGPMTDRLRMTADGWKIFERYLGAPIRNQALDPPNTA
ncbi:hypothetical protein N7508_009790 [Penicillium antarcticum]|uniref:uncharacterized protein n=1 Tax=Penicillium antarcticum TaxID=416450 RepID=UPI00238C77FB|nr:uncharacterized protein N7508_009790 [Penicillium antarcticum]KAJ5294969.1 hypothetical protein N7508_009790 [Penicillium antarcticum]